MIAKSAACVLALAFFGESYAVEPRPLEWAELGPETFDPRWQLPAARRDGGEDLVADIEALVAWRFDGAPARAPTCLGDLVAASADVEAQNRDEWLDSLEGRFPELFALHGEAFSELLLDERLFSRKWKPKDDHARDGMLLADEGWDLAATGAPWKRFGSATVEQGAVLIRADAATLRELENDYRTYPSDVGATYEWIRPLRAGFRTGTDPEGLAFAIVRFGMRNDLPFPFGSYEAEVFNLYRTDRLGRLVTDVYSLSEDLHWAAGRDVHLPVHTSAGEQVATVIVRLYGFDLDGIPDARRHRRTELRRNFGNLKRKAEARFRAERRSFAPDPGHVPDFPVWGEE